MERLFTRQDKRLMIPYRSETVLILGRGSTSSSFFSPGKISNLSILKHISSFYPRFADFLPSCSTWLDALHTHFRDIARSVDPVLWDNGSEPSEDILTFEQKPPQSLFAAIEALRGAWDAYLHTAEVSVSYHERLHKYVDNHPMVEQARVSYEQERCKYEEIIEQAYATYLQEVQEAEEGITQARDAYQKAYYSYLDAAKAYWGADRAYWEASQTHWVPAPRIPQRIARQRANYTAFRKPRRKTSASSGNVARSYWQIEQTKQETFKIREEALRMRNEACKASNQACAAYLQEVQNAGILAREQQAWAVFEQVQQEAREAQREARETYQQIREKVRQDFNKMCGNAPEMFDQASNALLACLVKHRNVLQLFASRSTGRDVSPKDCVLSTRKWKISFVLLLLPLILSPECESYLRSDRSSVFLVSMTVLLIHSQAFRPQRYHQTPSTRGRAQRRFVRQNMLGRQKFLSAPPIGMRRILLCALPNAWNVGRDGTTPAGRLDRQKSPTTDANPGFSPLRWSVRNSRSGGRKLTWICQT